IAVAGWLTARDPRAARPGSPRGCSVLVGAPEPVERPGAAAGGEEVEEDERVERSQFAAVEDREEAARSVGVEVGNRRHAGQDEGHRPREQAENDEYAPDELEQTGHAAADEAARQT